MRLSPIPTHERWDRACKHIRSSFVPQTKEHRSSSLTGFLCDYTCPRACVPEGGSVAEWDRLSRHMSAGSNESDEGAVHLRPSSTLTPTCQGRTSE
jgi:hypothetical protein